MTDPSSKAGHLGLASALTPDADSGVAALASRFNAAHKEAESPKLSDKVSSLANRFGATVHDEAGGGKYAAPASLRRPTSAGNAPRAPPARQPFLNHVDEDADRKKRAADIVHESAGSVGNVAKIFDAASDSAPLNKDPATDPDHDASNFRSAHTLFKNAELGAADGKTESKVSSFAKLIDSNATTARGAVDIPENNAIAGVAKAFETPKNGGTATAATTPSDPPQQPVVNAGIGDVVSKFENIRREESADKQQDAEETLENRFASAAKLFESGAANAKSSGQEPSKVSSIVSATVGSDSSKDSSESAPKPQQEEKAEEETTSSVQSRFADAARMFGGSS